MKALIRRPRILVANIDFKMLTAPRVRLESAPRMPQNVDPQEEASDS